MTLISGPNKTLSRKTPKSIIVPLLEGEQQDSFIDIIGPGVARPNSIWALLTTPTHTVHYYWRNSDNALRPVFVVLQWNVIKKCKQIEVYWEEAMKKNINNE
ncbi:hypothetical protein ACFE04_008950 [Oxalis oulophora]